MTTEKISNIAGRVKAVCRSVLTERHLFRNPGEELNSPSPSQTREFFRVATSLGSCCAMQNKIEIDICTKIVRSLGLPSHHDHQKNWDTLKSLFYLTRLENYNDPILDAGSSTSSVILKWLDQLGFQKLHACDIRQSSSSGYRADKIQFSVQDLTRTNYPDEFFGAVTCISVIEHGVDIQLFIEEMSRILKPSGYLLISTDYWSEPIDCSGIYPYGPGMGQMKVFTPGDIQNISRQAESFGFSLCSKLDLSTSERAVRWERTDRDYTFFFIALAKTP